MISLLQGPAPGDTVPAVRISFIFLLLALAIAVIFIAISSQLLPATVASHFGPAGAADGYMPRESYVRLMGLVTFVVPLLVALCNYLLRLIPASLINLPNRDYWLAPERKEETYAFFQNHGMVFSILIAAFLCFVHWSVIRANMVIPPHLSQSFIPGSLGFFSFLVVLWIGALIAHFYRRN
jgi:uncharacterized membrane protein